VSPTCECPDPGNARQSRDRAAEFLRDLRRLSRGITTVGYVLDWLRDELCRACTRSTIGRATSPTEADAVPGDHCQFCPVLLDCPKMQRAYRQYADASEDFVTMLTNEELDELYSQREYARRFMKVLETTVHARLMTGSRIPSAKLVEKQTARVWKPRRRRRDRGYLWRARLQAQGTAVAGRRRKAVVARQGIGAGIRLQARERRPVVAPLSDRRPEAKPRGNAGVFERTRLRRWRIFDMADKYDRVALLLTAEAEPRANRAGARNPDRRGGRAARDRASRRRH
jgi:hypothetical protein